MGGNPPSGGGNAGRPPTRRRAGGPPAESGADAPPAPAGVRLLRLLAVLGLVAGIWLVVLPAVAGRASLRSRIERQEARGIDPTALFYSELPERLRGGD